MNSHLTPDTPLPIDDLHRLIARYFDGDTDTDEERLLKSALARTAFHSPAIEEARAVLGYFATSGHQCRQPKRRHAISRYVAAAAVTIIAISVLVTWLIPSVNDTGECLAYISGQKTEDATLVKQAIILQIRSASEAADDVSASVASEFACMSEILNDNI